MKHKTFFITTGDNRPLDHLCGGTEEIEQNDLEVWSEHHRWWQIALTDEILKELDEEEKQSNADNS